MRFRFVVVGHPGHRRLALLQSALARCGLAPAEVVAWSDLVEHPQRFAAALVRGRAAWVKIDSPGEDARVAAAFVRRGWIASGQGGVLPDVKDPTEFAARDLWFAGFADTLRQIEAAARGHDVRWLNAPEDILAMCDKFECQSRLQAAGCRIPPLLGEISGYEDLRERMRSHGIAQVFLKARYGSSAAGVVAFRRHHSGRDMAFSTAEWLRDGDGGMRLYNSLRVRRYVSVEDIAPLVDALAAQGCYAERWIPKPRAPGTADAGWDLRVVACGGEARQRVARISRGAMTNLHLGNRRADPAGWLAAEQVDELEAHVRQAARAFGGSGSIGFDVLVSGARSFVLEANAFGDLLPDLRWQGCDAWDDQVRLFEAEAARG